MEVVLVELTNETCKIAVLEMLREDQLGEFLVLPIESISELATGGGS